MSDTLVERLRDEVYEWSGGLAVRDCDEDSQDLAELLREAADRIEELETRLKPLGGDCALTNCGKCWACRGFRLAALEESLRNVVTMYEHDDESWSADCHHDDDVKMARVGMGRRIAEARALLANDYDLHSAKQEGK